MNTMPMKNEVYIVWNIRTGEVRSRKTKPKQEKLEASEVPFKAGLNPVSYEEENESVTESDGSSSDSEDAEDVVFGEDAEGEEENE